MADEKKAQKPQNQLNIELPEDIAEGVYSNLAIIAHSNSEFIIDFVRILPNAPKAKVKSRVVLTPEHAKRLMTALADNIKKYENQFGTINTPGGSGNNGPQFPPMSFTPTAQGLIQCLISVGGTKEFGDAGKIVAPTLHSFPPRCIFAAA